MCIRDSGNIVRSRWTNFNTFINYSITPNTRIFLNGGLDYGDMRSNKLNQKKYAWQAMAFIGVQQTLPWNVNCLLYTSGRSFNECFRQTFTQKKSHYRNGE